MEITFSDQDLQQMPVQLREQLLAYISKIMERTPDQINSAGQGRSAEFSLSRPPFGARNQSDLVSLTRAQGIKFLKLLENKAELAHAALGQLVLERLEKMTPTDLAGALGLKNKETGKDDARLLSPYLKKITHAMHRFTGDRSAAWYTIDSNGMFYIDPRTADALRHAFKMHEAEGASEQPPGEDHDNIETR